MAIPPEAAVDNQLLDLLPEPDYNQIAPDLDYVKVTRGARIATAGAPIDHVYYLTSGIGSLVASTPEGNKAEAGIFGSEGYIPTSAAMGVELSVHDIIMQIEGNAYRMKFSAFRKWMDRNRNFARVMIRCIEAFSIQLTYTAISNALHGVDERLARWLLMCHDRVSGDEIPLTHEFISLMLAVRRPSVTTSLHVLEGNGFIRSNRGNIIIRNRQALEEFARDAYGKPEAEYRRLMTALF
ncbi:Crp/Fnr family transcriptional regulator [Sinorhizobium meliloti]|uniref:Crp/Fnr family transcriptional regulator n=1 Tax=Rhizobium meliloti TaxID=382 RepID=UPI00299F3338|nr:helix-turn-helix domain-containing protein [Sinorhizobium meliloti]MDW9621096.1 helix-turn-helix domain-containing protein [Sinorhizobium meliloti]MDX0159224.1 helix-turn-helix domain-containing protein [Sinorhizobium meliloti]MDX0178215.1 helix-turn-helix domain-containing protein [Sinorhizobium meliloti]MDX0321644.1 helix-turn-helix domain-containing protein [Sinorhizobium meliloti]